MQPKPIQVVGLVRFSVVSTTYYASKFGTPDKIAEHLFSPERMKLRFQLFENLCLPSLVAQTDKNFTCVVLTSDSLPDAYLSRLKTLLAPYPFLHLRQAGIHRHYPQLKAGFASVPADGHDHRVSFRLDDDDALDMNYISRLRLLSEGLFHMTGVEYPVAIAFNRGFYVRIQDGENEIFDAVERAPISAGTAVLAPVGHLKNPYRFNHRALPQHFSTYQDISDPVFIRTIHHDNKSTPTQMGLVRKKKMREIERDIRLHFGFETSMLRAL